MMCRHTGKPITDPAAHFAQSLQDLLTTRRGERVMQPLYGTNLLELMARTIDSDLLLDVASESAGAIDKWLPEINVQRVNVVPQREQVTIEVYWSMTALAAQQITRVEF